MKAIFIVYNQSLSGHVREILRTLALRGYTQWTGITGTGSGRGLPHEGTHVWPELNNAHLVVAEDEKSDQLLEKIRDLNETDEEQGIRAFEWNIERVVG